MYKAEALASRGNYLTLDDCMDMRTSVRGTASDPRRMSMHASYCCCSCSYCCCCTCTVCC